MARLGLARHAFEYLRANGSLDEGGATMGDVLDFKPLAPRRRKVRSHDLGYPKPEDEQAAKSLIDALSMRGLDIEIIPEDDGA
jgi:hypothetical protein